MQGEIDKLKKEKADLDLKIKSLASVNQKEMNKQSQKLEEVGSLSEKIEENTQSYIRADPVRDLLAKKEAEIKEAT
jgi:pyridoxine/pyridoxamine 5'-phosphate oxidase